jgi:hypothetical protein
MVAMAEVKNVMPQAHPGHGAVPRSVQEGPQP